MARLRVTESGPTRIKLKLDDWANVATNRTDELVYHPSEVDGPAYQLYAFNQKNMVIDISQDTGPLKKVVFVELLG